MSHSAEDLDLRLVIKNIELESDVYTLNRDVYVDIERRLQHQPIRYTYNRFESCRQTLMSGMFNVQSTVF